MEKGGKPMGSCASGFGVCCHFQFVCNSHTRENGTYWVNPATPQPMCHLMVTRMNSDICQIKLELDVFEIAGPNAKVGSLVHSHIVRGIPFLTMAHDDRDQHQNCLAWSFFVFPIFCPFGIYCTTYEHMTRCARASVRRSSSWCRAGAPCPRSAASTTTST